MTVSIDCMVYKAAFPISWNVLNDLIKWFYDKVDEETEAWVYTDSIWSSESTLLCMHAKSPQSCWLCAMLCTVAHQAPLSMRFSRQEYWNGLPFPSPEDLPNPRIKPRSPALQADSLPTELWGKPLNYWGSPLISEVKDAQSDFLRSLTLCESPCQNTGVGSLSLL